MDALAQLLEQQNPNPTPVTSGVLDGEWDQVWTSNGFGITCTPLS